MLRLHLIFSVAPSTLSMGFHLAASAPLGNTGNADACPAPKPRTTICILTRSWSDSFAKFEKSRLPQAPRSVHACLLSHFSHIWIPVPLWTVAHQAPLSMGFSRQGYWSGLPFPTWGTRSVDALVLEAEPRRIYWKFCSFSEKQKQKVTLACSHRNLDLNVYSSCIHNSQKLKQPRCHTLGEWVNIW